MFAFASRSSTAFRFTLSAALIGIVGAFALIIAALVQERQNRIEVATIQAENTSRLVAAYVLQTIQKMDMVMRDVEEHVRPADMRAKRGENPKRAEELHRVLDRKLAAIPEGSVMHLSNAAGDHLYSSLAATPRINVADRFHFIRQKNDPDSGLVLSPPLVSRTTGKWAFVASRRLNFEDGSFAGIINLIINLDGLEKFFASLDVMDHGVINMRDREMRLMARFPTAEKSVGRAVPDHPAFAFLGKSRNHAVYQAPGSVDGINRLYSVRSVGDLGLYVFVGLAGQDYLSDWSTHVLIYGFAWLVLASTVLLMVYMAWRGLIEQERTLAALRREEEKFHTVADYTYDWEYWQGPKHEILFMSPSCERVTGYSQADFLADPALLYRIVHPGDQHLMAKHLQDAAYADEEMMDIRIVRRDGETRWIVHGCRKVFGHDGQFMGRRASNRDITERKRAEQELHRAYAYNRSLIEASLDPLVTIGPDGKITDVNSATENATGLQRDQLIGTEFSAYFSDPGRARAGYQRVFLEGRVHDYELELRHRDGHLTPVVYNATVYSDDAGRIDGVFASARDITERKHAEQVVREVNVELERRVAQRTAELEAANKELEEFSYSMSHDMRSPLRAIDGFSKILLDEHGGQLDAEGRRLQAAVRGNAQRMGQLIDDILRFLKMRKHKVSARQVDLEPLVREAFAEYAAPLAAHRPIRLEVGTLPPAWADRDMVRLAIRNLMSNAVKFSSPGRDTFIEVSGVAEGGENVYHVKDNGVGFDMRYADKLFKVFERVHRTGQYEGTGIGLALVKRIVERHGGRVWAEGSVGEGAVFHFSLPSPAAAK